MNKRTSANAIVPLIDYLLVPFVLPAAILLKVVRRFGLARLRLTRAVLLNVGVLPLRSHYYEPFVRPADLLHPLGAVRSLPGVDFDMVGQLGFLAKLTFEGELGHLGGRSVSVTEYAFGNSSFESGDAEFLYQVIRLIKPSRILEIGSGHSTLMAREAVRKNRAESDTYACRHVCIEPYEMPWLEQSGVEVIRSKVENVDRSIFHELSRGDILFIDSSHVIRPQGDVLTEYLEILPLLQTGVIVHIHDIFSPRDYPREWVVDSLLLWNEQYLMEAFLSNNKEWKIIGALNMLKHDHFESLKRVCPYLTLDREPGSIYLEKI
jgi:hypothetical protein